MNRETVITAILGLLLVLAIGVLLLMLSDDRFSGSSGELLPGVPTEHYGTFVYVEQLYNMLGDMRVVSVKTLPGQNGQPDRYCIDTQIKPEHIPIWGSHQYYLLRPSNHGNGIQDWFAEEIESDEFKSLGC